MATQAEVAAHLLLTERTIRDLQKLARSPVPRGRGSYDLDAWREFYIRYLRAQKALPQDGREPEMEDDEEAKALKLREAQLRVDERAERIAAQRAKRLVFERSYAPLGLITHAVEKVATALNARLEALVPRVKQACPDIPAEALEELNREIIAASNELADLRPDLSDYAESGEQSSDPWALDTEEEAAD